MFVFLFRLVLLNISISSAFASSCYKNNFHFPFDTQLCVNRLGDCLPSLFVLHGEQNTHENCPFGTISTKKFQNRTEQWEKIWIKNATSLKAVTTPFRFNHLAVETLYMENILGRMKSVLSQLFQGAGYSYMTRSRINILDLKLVRDEELILQEMKPESCFDHVKGGNEEHMDCGGSCAKCEPLCFYPRLRKNEGNNFERILSQNVEATEEIDSIDSQVVIYRAANLYGTRIATSNSSFIVQVDAIKSNVTTEILVEICYKCSVESNQRDYCETFSEMALDNFKGFEEINDHQQRHVFNLNKNTYCDVLRNGTVYFKLRNINGGPSNIDLTTSKVCIPYVYSKIKKHVPRQLFINDHTKNAFQVVFAAFCPVKDIVLLQSLLEKCERNGRLSRLLQQYDFRVYKAQARVYSSSFKELKNCESTNPLISDAWCSSTCKANIDFCTRGFCSCFPLSRLGSVISHSSLDICGGESLKFCTGILGIILCGSVFSIFLCFAMFTCRNKSSKEILETNREFSSATKFRVIQSNKSSSNDELPLTIGEIVYGLSLEKGMWFGLNRNADHGFFSMHHVILLQDSLIPESMDKNSCHLTNISRYKDASPVLAVVFLTMGTIINFWWMRRDDLEVFASFRVGLYCIVLTLVQIALILHQNGYLKLSFLKKDLVVERLMTIAFNICASTYCFFSIPTIAGGIFLVITGVLRLVILTISSKNEVSKSHQTQKLFFSILTFPLLNSPSGFLSLLTIVMLAIAILVSISHWVIFLQDHNIKVRECQRALTNLMILHNQTIINSLTDAQVQFFSKCSFYKANPLVVFANTITHMLKIFVVFGLIPFKSSLLEIFKAKFLAIPGASNSIFPQLVRELADGIFIFAIGTLSFSHIMLKSLLMAEYGTEAISFPKAITSFMLVLLFGLYIAVKPDIIKKFRQRIHHAIEVENLWMLSYCRMAITCILHLVLFIHVSATFRLVLGIFMFLSIGEKVYFLNQSSRIESSNITSVQWYSNVAYYTFKLFPKKADQELFQQGQYLLIKFPKLSHYEWHPVFIVSSRKEYIDSGILSVVLSTTKMDQSNLQHQHSDEIVNTRLKTCFVILPRLSSSDSSYNSKINNGTLLLIGESIQGTAACMSLLRSLFPFGAQFNESEVSISFHSVFVCWIVKKQAILKYLWFLEYLVDLAAELTDSSYLLRKNISFQVDIYVVDDLCIPRIPDSSSTKPPHGFRYEEFNAHDVLERIYLSDINASDQFIFQNMGDDSTPMNRLKNLWIWKGRPEWTYLIKHVQRLHQFRSMSFNKKTSPSSSSRIHVRSYCSNMDISMKIHSTCKEADGTPSIHLRQLFI